MAEQQQRLFAAGEIGWANWEEDRKTAAPREGRRRGLAGLVASSVRRIPEVKRSPKKSVDNSICPLDGMFGCGRDFCSSLCPFSSR